MKDSKGNIAWNLHLKEVAGKLELIMPDTYGEFSEEIKNKKAGYLVSWPLNPHFTGKETIIMFLEASGKFKEQII